MGADHHDQNNAPDSSISHTQELGMYQENSLACSYSRFESYSECVGYVEEANKKEGRGAAPPQSREVVKVAREEWETPLEAPM